jgi:DNA-binding transcriptional MerR regulator
MRLKKFYSSREVATLTGLSARQLQWWDTRRLFPSAIAPKRTPAGGFTERRYTTVDVLELQILGDLRRRGFSVPRIRHLLTVLREVFGVRLYEVIGEGEIPALLIKGDQLYVRTDNGLFNIEEPTQALLVDDRQLSLRPVTVRERRRRSSGSAKPSRGRRQAEE